MIKRGETKVGDLVISQGGKVGIVTNLRNNNSADIVWISDNSTGLVNLWWLYIFSRAKKSLNKK